MAQTTNKYQIIQKTSTTDTVLLHPETEACVVEYDNGTSGLTATNAQGAIDELKQKISTIEGGVVTGVKGNSESNYRHGNVNITAANVGAEAAGSVSTHNSSSSAHSDIRTSVTTAQNRADAAYSLAEGRARAVSFDTVAAMKTALSSASATDYKIGDNLFIKATDVPDYWVSKVNSSKSGDYGYYEVSALESQKVDLSSYQTKTDNGLSTTSKTIVGGINEVIGRVAIAEDQVSSMQQAVTDIITGDQIVGKATTATSATSATSATLAGKWTTARTISVGVSSGTVAGSSTVIMGTGSASIDGSANKTITVNLGDSGVTAGTYSAVQVNAKGIAVAGGQMIEVGTSGQTSPSATLATGGLFFKLI